MQISSINGAYFGQNSVRYMPQRVSRNLVTQNPFQTGSGFIKPAANLYNLQQQNISFKRRLKEHRSWGGAIDPNTKEVSFKIFTFPDAKSVDVKIFDAKNPDEFKTYALENMGNGVFQSAEKLSPNEAKVGDRYSFLIKKSDGTTVEVKDPYAMRQGNKKSKDFLNYSILYDHSEFEWKNNEVWKASGERITRKPQGEQKSIREASIYEMHIDTLTKEGTYDAAKEKLKEIKKAGFNTIELMPNENTFYFNWGYDGVDKFAPPEHRGGPDKLKELIDYAHGLELNVVMDYVPNHLGADGARLKETGPYVKGKNDFGEAFNFEGENSRYVRDYIVNAGLNWIDNYKVDGLRLDMTRFMESDYAMKEIAAEINYHFPDAFLIAEDARNHTNTNGYDYWIDENELHDKRIVSPLLDYEHCEGKSEDEHCDYIDSIDSAVRNIKGGVSKKMLSNLGYDAEWDFPYHHALDKTVYSGKDIAELVNAIYHSQNAVKYTASHDETGNMDGTRRVVKYLVPKLNLNSNVILNSKDLNRVYEYAKLKEVPLQKAKNDITCQKAQSVAESLCIMLAEGKLDKYKYQPYDKFYEDILKDLGIKQNAHITYKRLCTAFKNSAAQVRMTEALTFAIPGPKMVFQGDENIELTPFRFFRQFESHKNEPKLEIEKGYDTGRAAFHASIFGNIEYSDSATEFMSKHMDLTRDLNKLNRENPALTKGWLVLNEDGSRDALIYDNTMGLHIKDEESQNEFFIISNFKNESYPTAINNAYNINFPEGKWVEVLNTDDIKYGGSGKFSNEGEIIEGFGLNGAEEDKVPIRLKEHSTVYFKRVG